MSRRHGQKARLAIGAVADDLRARAARVDRVLEWAGAAWRPGRNPRQVADWLGRTLDGFWLEHCTPEADDCEPGGILEQYAGWYFSFSSVGDSIWKKSWDSARGPVVDDVFGPFKTEESARQELLRILCEAADDCDWPSAEAATGELVRAARLRAGLTQVQASEKAGIHQPQWAILESGVSNPSLTTLRRAAAALGCPLRDLVA